MTINPFSAGSRAAADAAKCVAATDGTENWSVGTGGTIAVFEPTVQAPSTSGLEVELTTAADPGVPDPPMVMPREVRLTVP